MELIKVVFIGKVKLEEKARLVQRDKNIVNEKITFVKTLGTNEITEAAIGCSLCPSQSVKRGDLF